MDEAPDPRDGAVNPYVIPVGTNDSFQDFQRGASSVRGS
jgi:hypothetical protein